MSFANPVNPLKNILNGIPTKYLTKEEWDALSEDGKMDDILYIVDEPSISLPVPEPSEEVYSTEETVIGRWIDGKPLYRRAYDLFVPTFNARYRHQIAPTVPNLEKVIRLSGIIHRTDGVEDNVPLTVSGYAVALSYFKMDIAAAAAIAGINAYAESTAYMNCPWTVIIEYTKTTDEGGE